ncbi:MAG: hypothetical protein IKP46_06055 [Bacteroidales bacterium]|nr:hypothetical protein [Bacteroidales bacterium]
MMRNIPYAAPSVRVAEILLEKNYVYSPGSAGTNPDNNEVPVDGGSENF